MTRWFIFLILTTAVLAVSCTSEAGEIRHAAAPGLQSPVRSVPDVHISKSDTLLTRKGGLIYYDNHPYSGYIDSYYEGAVLSSRSRYLEGKREGMMMGFYPDGQKRERRTYRNNRKHGHHEGWWPNGSKRFDYHFSDGVAEGSHRTWYSSGVPYQEFTYLHGKEDGAQKLWKPDGTVRGNYVVKNGHRYGLIGLKNCKSVKYDDSEYEAVAY
ncbi:MAG: hypothetical protein WBB45_20230 [Cyclobacteriaceae bacterium]